MLSAVGEGAAIAHYERRSPGICAEDVGKPVLRISVVPTLARQVIKLAGHDGEACAVRSSVSVLPWDTKAPRVCSSLRNCDVNLVFQRGEHGGLVYGEAARISSDP